MAATIQHFAPGDALSSVTAALDEDGVVVIDGLFDPGLLGAVADEIAASVAFVSNLFLLRQTDRSVTEISIDVGFLSLGTFSRTFRDIVGESPTRFRESGQAVAVPTCFAMSWTRPSSFGEAKQRVGA